MKCIVEGCDSNKYAGNGLCNYHYHRQPEVKEKVWAYSLKKYGITPVDYNQMFAKQNGCCLYCDKHQSEFDYRLCVDHNHTTGKVRGLLCYRCNVILGTVENNLELVKKMLAGTSESPLFN